MAAGRSGRAGGAREAVGSPRGVAAGVPESSSMLGMMLLPSLPICTAIGGPYIDFGLESKNGAFFSKISVFCLCISTSFVFVLIILVIFISNITRSLSHRKFFGIVVVVKDD